MTIALDVGAHRLRTLRHDGHHLLGRSWRSAYAAVPDSPGRRQLLDQLQVPYGACEDTLVVLADAAAQFATVLQTPCRRLLSEGRFPAGDDVSRQILATLVESLLGTPERLGEYCGLVAPAGEVTEFLVRLVQRQGFRPVALHAGMAVVLAETVHDRFSGLGISLGAGGCEASIAYHATELAHVTHPRGGDWIDERVAREAQVFAWDAGGRTFLDVDAVARFREGQADAVAAASAGLAEAVAGAYRELAITFVHTLRRDLAASSSLPRLPERLPVVLSGRLACAPGLAALIERELRSADLPVRLGDFRLAADSDYLIARGALIQAELEAETAAATRAAA